MVYVRRCRSIPGETVQDALRIRDYVLRFAQHPCQLRYHGNVLVSTFSGEKSLFGQRDLDSAWSFVKKIIRDAGVEVRHLDNMHILTYDPPRFISSRHGLSILSDTHHYIRWMGTSMSVLFV